MERAIEAQRLRLLRILAGLVLAVGFLSLAPLSQVFSSRAREVLSSVLSRAELAARYLVVLHARVLAEPSVDHHQLIETALRDHGAASDTSLAGLKGRLRALQILLNTLPRHGLRLLRKIERAMRAVDDARAMPFLEPNEHSIDSAWRMASARIDRPPDKRLFHSMI